jgi:hypothetical protein
MFDLSGHKHDKNREIGDKMRGQDRVFDMQ